MIIKLVTNQNIPKNIIKKVSILVNEQKLNWKMDDQGLIIETLGGKPDYQYAYPIKIELKSPMAWNN
ncbi:hypothetical protein D9V96_013930 [Zobellia laminariae]|uniref:hypothetical protein n=1 Tax=Zobellia laminariae TaxID=248906 RepID=UPI0012D9CB28|nr:hypothetical protein [Zobellia laminariae]